MTALDKAKYMYTTLTPKEQARVYAAVYELVTSQRLAAGQLEMDLQANKLLGGERCEVR